MLLQLVAFIEYICLPRIQHGIIPDTRIMQDGICDRKIHAGWGFPISIVIGTVRVVITRNRGLVAGQKGEDSNAAKNSVHTPPIYNKNSWITNGPGESPPTGGLIN
jgi:putative component of toxin-antitoxin plasmid stabilization module